MPRQARLDARPPRLKAKPMAGRELSDDRILGSGHFVAEVLRAANEFEEKRIKKSIPIDQLADKITSYFGIKIDDILIKSQKSKISKARSIICYLAIKEMKYSGTSVGKFLNIRRYSALRCAERGKNILLCRETTFVDMIRRHFLDDADSLRNKR